MKDDSVAKGNVDPGAVLRVLFEGRERTRVALVGGGILAFIILVGVVGWGERPLDDYALLCGPIEDRARLMAIADDLDNCGVTYRIGKGGMIEVPHDELALAISSVIETTQESGGDTSDTGGLFGASLGLPSSQARRDSKIRQRESDLSRTISLYDAVRQARVHISRPDDRLFSSRGKEVRASVLLRLVPDRNLSRRQVRAIRDVVASGVPGLAPERVVITDSLGTDYSSVEPVESRFSVTKELEIQGRMETVLADKIRHHLASLFGDDHVTVAVTVQIDSDVVAGHLERTAVPAERPSLTTMGMLTEGAATGEVARMDTAPGARSLVDAIANLCIAVFIDSTIFDGHGIPADLRSAVVESINTVARIDETRGDQISVLAVPFSQGRHGPRHDELQAPASTASTPLGDHGSHQPSFPSVSSDRQIVSSSRPWFALLAFMAFCCVGGLIFIRRRNRTRQLEEDALALSGAFNVGAHGGSVDALYWDDSASQDAFVPGALDGDSEVVARLIRSMRNHPEGCW